MNKMTELLNDKSSNRGEGTSHGVLGKGLENYERVMITVTELDHTERIATVTVFEDLADGVVLSRKYKSKIYSNDLNISNKWNFIGYLDNSRELVDKTKIPYNLENSMTYLRYLIKNSEFSCVGNFGLMIYGHENGTETQILLNNESDLDGIVSGLLETIIGKFNDITKVENKEEMV